MYYPATRLLTVLELLRSRGRMSGAELAEALEVDSRTVRRYVTMLQDLGMPIETERGRAGGYKLRPNYRLPPLVFSEDEVVALTLGMLFARRLGLSGAATAAETAVAKMERVLPSVLREQVQMMDETLSMRLPMLGVAPASETIMALTVAAYRNQRVEISYQKSYNEETRRQVDPYAIVHTLGLWYMVGYCHLRRDLRTFRLDRVAHISMCAETFVPPQDFDALNFVESSVARTPWGLLTEVLLQTTLEEARKLVPATSAILKPDPAGVIMQSFAYDLDDYALFLAGLPCPMIVRQPEELLKALERLAAKAVALAQHR